MAAACCYHGEKQTSTPETLNNLLKLTNVIVLRQSGTLKAGDDL